MIMRISSSSERKAPTARSGGRFEARLADGGWVVFDTQLEKIVIADGRRLERLSGVRAHAKAEDLNSRERAKH